MVVVVPCKDVLDYESQLSSFIAKGIHNDKRITFIDCRNSIHPYLFKRHDLPKIMNRLFISRVERLHDFIDQLERIAADPYFKQSDVLLISSYVHLLDDIPVNEKKQSVHTITKMLSHLEHRHHITVVLLDLHNQWDTLFTPNGRLSTAG